MSENYNKIKIEFTDGMSNTTPYASLIFMAEFWSQSGLSKVTDKAIGARKARGARGSEHIMAFVMSQICGNEAIEQQKQLPSRVELLGIKVPSVTPARY